MGEVKGNNEYSGTINHISEQQNIEHLKQNVPELFSRQGKIKGYKINCEIPKNASITQQKKRRVPLQLQDAEDEIKKLLKGHTRRVDKIGDKVFKQPVVVIVKKDKTAKIPLQASSLTNAILKEKYQMLNWDNLM